jgi:hypothetical protein
MTLFMYMYIYVCQSYIILTVKVKQKHLLLLHTVRAVQEPLTIENDIVLSWYGTVLSPALISSALSEAPPTRLRCTIKLCTSTVP